MKKAIIIGAGPVGLATAYELLKKTDIKLLILEEINCIVGISKKRNRNGNRMYLGGEPEKEDKSVIWNVNMEEEYHEEA